MGKAVGGVLGGVGGVVNNVLRPFGLGGDQGAYVNGPDMSKANTALDAYSGFLKDPSAAMGTATKEVQDNALTHGLFGEGGLQSQLEKEGNTLANTGYQLQPQDREAYGQAAGDISRMYGQQEQAGTQALARRGLASGNSGAAGAMFSGLQGSKNEQLARAQTDIAQKRMADTQQRLQANRALQSQLGLEGNQMAQQNFNNRGKSLGENYNVLNSAANQNYQNQRQTLSDQQGAQGQTLFGQIGKGIGGLVGNIGSVWGGGMAGKGMAGGSQSQDKQDTGSGGGGGGLGGMIGSVFSDERLKENTRDGSKSIRSFLDSIKPNEYEYKGGAKGSLFGGHDTYVSPMAQELEKTDLGSSMVRDTPDGKVVDYGKGMGTILAAQSDLNSRLKALEKGLH